MTPFRQPTWKRAPLDGGRPPAPIVGSDNKPNKSKLGDGDMTSQTEGDGDVRPDVLVLSTLPDWDMEPLAAQFRLLTSADAPDRTALIARASAVRAIAAPGHRGADAALMDALPALEIIANYGVGVDGIDLEAARQRGIRVTNTPDVLTGDVADLAIALALAAMREIPRADAHVRGGGWAKGNLPLARRFHGCKLGIVGLGRIGAAIAKRAAAFDCTIGYFNRSPQPAAPYKAFPTIEALADWSDVLVVTVAGGAGTRALIDTAVLQALGPQGYLVNVSRGSTVDEPALLDALEGQAIAGAALDVFLNEPNIDARFKALPNVVLLPHHGSATVETRRAMGQLMRDNLTAHFAGQPLLTPVV
jgi:lactate dehydrogenase-like 2-hydroxyacid dehydrogenase